MSNSQPLHLERGRRAESAALDYLEAKGLELVETNYSCLCGEVDLVMMDRDELVFIEVRYRKSLLFGGAIDSINAAKKRKLKLTAEYFLQNNRKMEFKHCRFDVLAITGNGANLLIDWICDAF